MSEMVERVARAMFAAIEPASEWDDEGERNQNLWREQARAAIEAMREPTEEMIEAARLYGVIGPHDCKSVWWDMTDEALK